MLPFFICCAFLLPFRTNKTNILVLQAAESLCQVEACAVIWYQQEKLILFVVPKDNLAEEDAFKELQKCLPVHAVPDELVLIEALPVTLHGN